MATIQKTAANFSIDQGADFSKNFTITTDGSTAYDLSGLVLQAEMRQSYDSSSASATFTCTLVTASSGIYKLTSLFVTIKYTAENKKHAAVKM